MVVLPLTLGAAARPYPGEEVNGDAWTVQQHTETTCRLAVIDGLGHGANAAAAAHAAVAVLEDHPELSVADALRACHTALHATRGAAIWLGHFDLQAQTLEVCGAGNVQARLWRAGRSAQLATARGIVGAALPRVHQETHALTDEDWLLIVFTDGIRDRFELPESVDHRSRSPSELAETIVEHWSRPTDDATVVVALPRQPAG